MLKNYKKSFLVINIILGLLLALMITNILVFKQTSYLFLITAILVPTLIIIGIYGYERKSRRFKYEYAFYVFAYSALFLLVTYILGLFTGFTSSVYKLNFTGIIHNIIPYLLLIIVSEVLRYEISRKGYGSLLTHIQIILIMILVDLTLFLTTFDLTTGDGQIKYICSILLPSLFKNIALMYFSRKGGLLPILVYRIILDLKLVVLPIYPKFGIYLESIIYTILPAIMMFIIYFQTRDLETNEDTSNIKKTIFYKYVILFIVMSSAIAINILVSGAFNYKLIAIGSGSMMPVINKGDAVIYEKITENKEPKVGNILVFKKEDKTIVHRIIEIVDIGNDEKVYYTKGDANEDPDGYPITRSQILGIVKKRIKYIGLPSVTLGEMVNK